MGNTHNRNSQNRSFKQSAHTEREGQAFTSQFSLSGFGNLSGRSVASNQSVYSASRPWSRVSRRRWNDTTLASPLEASKTAWPVAHRESIFLPEFPISTDIVQRDFEIQQLIAKGAYAEVHKVLKKSEGKEYALKVLNKSDLRTHLILIQAIQTRSKHTMHICIAVRHKLSRERYASPRYNHVWCTPISLDRLDQDQVKVIKDNAVRQVKEEARIQTAVGHHLFIAGAVARWQTKKRLYIVSEYIPGGELLALLEKYGKLPEELVKIFVAEIALGIDFLHNAGVIYRDLKPENILLDEDCHIQLVDFGLSKWLSLGARTTTLCGTLKYMAPEVLSREPYGHAVDWWSLGVIVCRMLTDTYPTPGIMPRASGDADAGSTATSEGKEVQSASSRDGKNPVPGTLPASASELSNAARGLLMRLLDRDPRVRLRSLRKLQQTAFFMGFDFELVKEKKISPKDILEHYFPDGPYKKPTTTEPQNPEPFIAFDQVLCLNLE